jgi:hypothetical protein
VQDAPLPTPSFIRETNIMQVFKNVFNQETLDKCKEDLNYSLGYNVWRCSDHFWGAEITVGVSGVCSSTLVSAELKEMIKNCLTPYLPEYTDLTIQHYLWHKHSGISLHNDWSYRFGATVYLNQAWDIAYGGIFLWRDNEGSLRAVAPEYNTMVVNTDKLNHMVTSISPLTPENRVTIQIWGH